MSIEAINEQLLRAIGVGVALVDLETLKLRFRNDTFAGWFGTADHSAKLAELFPALDIVELATQLTNHWPWLAIAYFVVLTLMDERTNRCQHGGCSRQTRFAAFVASSIE